MKKFVFVIVIIHILTISTMIMAHAYIGVAPKTEESLDNNYDDDLKKDESAYYGSQYYGGQSFGGYGDDYGYEPHYEEYGAGGYNYPYYNRYNPYPYNNAAYGNYGNYPYYRRHPLNHHVFGNRFGGYYY